MTSRLSPFSQQEPAKRKAAMGLKFNLSLAVRICLYVTLCGVCFNYFTYPSWEKYQSKKTIITTQEVKQEKISAPAVTICPANAATGAVVLRRITLPPSMQITFYKSSVKSKIM